MRPMSRASVGRGRCVLRASGGPVDLDGHPLREGSRVDQVKRDVRRAWRPHDAVLGRVDNLKGYHDTERHPDAHLIPGLVLYRFDAPLFFANTDYFHQRVRALADSGDVTWIVVAAEPITDIDATAGEALHALNDELDAIGIELAFAELKDPVRDRLRRYGVEKAIGGHRFFPTIGVAVTTYLHETGVDWDDWKDRQTDHRALPDP
jgi:MFS superfamily sulfate permease-like transporter